MADQQSTEQEARTNLMRRAVSSMVFLIFILVVAVAGWMLHYSKTPGPPGPPEVVVSIPRGSSVDKIGRILAQAGVIHGDIRFTYLARLNGKAGKLRAGEFALRTGKLPSDIMTDLSTATPLQHRVTIAEGLKAEDIAYLFARDKWCDPQLFLKLVHDAQFINTLGFEKLTSLEGYLYPDTYFLTRIPEMTTEDIITMMVRRFQDVWSLLDGVDGLMHDTVTLASIVEKETAAPSERSLIASVFQQRLARGMKLQSDPTVIYGIKNFSGNLTRKDLRTATPYNTYVIHGLPPGPICNPGRDAMAAVLHPADEKYLYFVSKNDGTHYFSKSLNEHNRAVYKYQKRKRKKAN